ncbi:MarR family transcriptional regulator [Ruegeria sp. HKCCD4884]|uniref:MarR family winged helix-turn-helix transcriptional regulator n=1 Tax=Ruegeria sp. HKCCD4884 TaxID=2683022 RepID=UPI001491DBA9|nr:MarR family winged helix-turn-helix transcriptional regulator [Ruegeria sp. HKCCD4884]NOD95031.1 MarR family transcriptional regulator [Ruegeria sp. HKCCD4884]
MTHVESKKNDEFDLQNFLPFLLNQAAEHASLEFQSVYKGRYGMLRTEWRVLFHLGLFGEMTAKEICERARMHKTKISRAVAKLEQRRYLKRTRDEADRRAEWLTLTPAGQTVYRDLHGVAADYDAKLSGLFDAEEAALLRKMLRRLAGLD